MATATINRITNVNGNGKHAATITYPVPDFGPTWHPKPTALSNGWGVAVADVGPELAEAMLQTNVDNQRTVSQAGVDKLAADMMGGHWKLTHQGIAFNQRGQLHDGQHRLYAIMQCGAVIPMMVFFGVGEEPEMAVIDTGRNRTAFDATNVMGLDVKNTDIAVAVCLMSVNKIHGTSGRGFTTSEKIEAVNQWSKWLKISNDLFGKVRGGVFGVAKRAPSRAAVAAAAANGIDQHALARFVGVLLDQIPATEPSDSVPLKLRHHSQAGSTGRGGYAVSEFYERVCKAIEFFIAGRTVTKCYPGTGNPYPMPFKRK